VLITIGAKNTCLRRATHPQGHTASCQELPVFLSAVNLTRLTSDDDGRNMFRYLARRVRERHSSRSSRNDTSSIETRHEVPESSTRGGAQAEAGSGTTVVVVEDISAFESSSKGANSTTEKRVGKALPPTTRCTSCHFPKGNDGSIITWSSTLDRLVLSAQSGCPRCSLMLDIAISFAPDAVDPENSIIGWSAASCALEVWKGALSGGYFRRFDFKIYRNPGENLLLSVISN